MNSPLGLHVRCYAVVMKTTVTLPEAVFNELMALTEAKTQGEAVEVAVQRFVQQARRDQLRAYRGKVDILSNDEIESTETVITHAH